MNTAYFQQGDCMLKPISIPKGTKAIKTLTLIRSQVTGNEHKVSGKAVVLKNGETLYVRSKSAFSLVHTDPKEGHKTLKIPAGEYVIDQPLEFDHVSEEARAVAD